MKRRLPPAPPKLPDRWMYDIVPGSNAVVRAKDIQKEMCWRMENSGGHWRTDPSYWWRKRKKHDKR